MSLVSPDGLFFGVSLGMEVQYLDQSSEPLCYMGNPGYNGKFSMPYRNSGAHDDS